MKRVLFVLLLLLPIKAWGQAGVCQGFTTSSGQALACTFNQNIATGTVLLVNVVCNLSTQATVTIGMADSTALNNYGSPIADSQKQLSGNQSAPSSIRIATFGTTTGGPITTSTVLTVSFTVVPGAAAGAVRTVDVEAFPGATLVTDGVALHGGQNVALTTGTVNTTNANDVLVASFGIYGSPGVDNGSTNPFGVLPETNWSLGGEYNAGVASADRSIVVETFSTGATGAYTGTASLTGTSNRVYASTLIALKMGASTPTPTITLTPTLTVTPTTTPTPTCAPACCDNISGSPQCQAMVGCGCPGGYTQHIGEACP